MAAATSEAPLDVTGNPAACRMVTEAMPDADRADTDGVSAWSKATGMSLLASMAPGAKVIVQDFVGQPLSRPGTSFSL